MVTGAEVSIRDRLPGDLLLAFGVGWSLVALNGLRLFGLGWDARAYYEAWDGSLYEVQPGRAGAFNYSPLFAQALWPLAQLPWPVFCAVLVGSAAIGSAWLVWPLGGRMAVGLFGVCLPEIFSGNIYWLLAVLAVLGVRAGAPWCVAATSKILPTVGPIWFLVRREWKPLVHFVVTLSACCGVSYLAAPGLWIAWVDFLTDNSGGTGAASLPGVPPLWLRLPVALLLTVVGARSGRAWLLAPAMLFATPIVGAGSFALLAAIPRLRSGTRTTPPAGSTHGY